MFHEYTIEIELLLSYKEIAGEKICYTATIPGVFAYMFSILISHGLLSVWPWSSAGRATEIGSAGGHGFD